MTERIIRLHEGARGWTFQPVAPNGEPQAQSEPYASRGNAVRGAHDLFPDDLLTFEAGKPADQ